MLNDQTTDTCYGYTRNEWLALPAEQRHLIEKDATVTSQSALQAELDAFTEAYFASDEWQLDLGDAMAGEAPYGQDDWLQEVDDILGA